MGSNLEAYKENAIEKQIKPDMDISLLYYYILDKENIDLTKKMVDDRITEEAKTISDEEDFRDRLIEYYGEYYFETMIAKDLALDFMYDNAKIK